MTIHQKIIKGNDRMLAALSNAYLRLLIHARTRIPTDEDHKAMYQCKVAIAENFEEMVTYKDVESSYYQEAAYYKP